MFSRNPGDTAFYDPAFINYFHELVKKHDVCEYYLNEVEGALFFCHQKEKQALYLLIQRKVSMISNLNAKTF
jgi:hypothetical protein